MAMTQEKGQQNARFLLFADFSVPPEKALLYINDMSLLTDINLILATFSILFVSESTEGIEEGQSTASKR